VRKLDNSKYIPKNLMILLVINGHKFTAKHRIPLIQYLISLGYNVKCIVPKKSAAQLELINNNIPTINWDLSRKGLNPFTEIKSIFKLFEIYKRELPDIVIHATIKPVIYGSIVSYIAKLAPIINLITGLGSVFISKGWFKGLIKFSIITIYKLIFRLIPQTIIFQNKSDKQKLLNNYHYPLLKCAVISGSGVNVANYPIYDLPSKKRITLIGRIIKEKGIITFIEAIKIIKEGRQDICFTLVGPIDAGNPSFINQKTVNKWEAENILEWWGDVDDIVDVYKQSSIVVLPSHREGLPKTLLEASLTGRPVIASDVPGCRDVVVHGKTGYLFPLNDSETFASHILDLIDIEEKMENMGLAGRKYVIDKFSTDIILPQIVNEIENSIKYHSIYQ